MLLLSRTGLRPNENDIRPGAQGDRQGKAWAGADTRPHRLLFELTYDGFPIRPSTGPIETDWTSVLLFVAARLQLSEQLLEVFSLPQ